MYSVEYSDFPNGERKTRKGFRLPDSAWGFLLRVRMKQEENTPGGPLDTAQYEETQTVEALRFLTYGDHVHGAPTAEWPTAADGSGRVLGCEPGRELDESAPDWSYSVRRY